MTALKDGQPDESPRTPTEHVEIFLRLLRNAVRSRSVEAFVDLFHDEGWYRDIHVFDWDYRSIPKRNLAAFVAKRGLPDLEPGSIRIDPSKSSPDQSSGVIRAFIIFETSQKYGQGVLRLATGSSGVSKALTLGFTLSSFKAFQEPVDSHRPNGYEQDPLHRTWQERRDDELNFIHEDPDVVIVGAGHGGLMLASHLQRLGLKTLLIDKARRIGDTWRNRYRSLVIHDPIYADRFPYLDYPSHWPMYIPKDAMASWHEIFANAMQLNVWLETTLVPGTSCYDEGSHTWKLSIDRKDGSRRNIKCRHLVQATGVSGLPYIPNIPGAREFAGTMFHSSSYTTPNEWRGKNVVIVGCGNSAHDIAHELYEAGAKPTMVQRSSGLVFSVKNGNPVYYKPSLWHGGPPLEEIDLSSACSARPQSRPSAIETWKKVNEADKDLLNRLEKSGYRLDPPGGPGAMWKQYERGGGYCVNVGSAELIIAGKIKIKHGAVVKFEKEGACIDDGTLLPADLIIMATGFGSMRDAGRSIFGNEVIDRTGPVWGLDSDDELQGVGRYSGHPGFWYMGGSIFQARNISKYLALLIKGIEMGYAPRDRASV